MTANHSDKKLHSMCSYVWLLVALFVATIFSAAYTAVLTTFLVSKDFHRLPASHDLLMQDVGAIRSSSDAEYLRDIEGFRFLKELSLEEAVSSVNNGSIKAFFGPRVILEYIADSDCSVYVPNSNSEFELRREKIAFPIQKGSPLLESINSHVQKMWDSNYLAQLERRHFYWSSQCQGDGVKDVDIVDLKEVAVLFIVLLGVAVIGIVVHCAIKMKRKKETKKEKFEGN